MDWTDTHRRMQAGEVDAIPVKELEAIERHANGTSFPLPLRPLVYGALGAGALATLLLFWRRIQG